MATFYVLPPRPVLQESLCSLVRAWVPGLGDPSAVGGAMVEALVERAASGETFVVGREDLPDGQAVGDALGEGFGAEPGDAVVEVRPAPGGGWAARTWTLGAEKSDAAADASI